MVLIMAKKQFTIFSCDICKKEFETEEYPEELKRVGVMGRKFDCEGRSFSVNTVSCDLCKDCRLELFEVTSKYFALVDDCYGITAKKRGADNAAD